MDVYKAIEDRKSVRAFEDRDIPEATLMRLPEDPGTRGEVTHIAGEDDQTGTLVVT